MSTKEETAQKIANLHYSVEEGMRSIFRVRRNPDMESSPDEPIKLLEVNEFTVSAGVMPLGFTSYPDLGIDYPSIIVEVTPAEYAKIQSQQLRLPDGWIVGEELPRLADANGDE